MRGVHLVGIHLHPLAVGSSPHARGPLRGAFIFLSFHRIIPACAGSTALEVDSSEQAGDHPRMRGVHFNVPPITTLSLGSSPHARGPRSNKPFMRWTKRIIPACAGSTQIHARKHPFQKDHPRMRGVHSPDAALFPLVVGSSPHARGPLQS